MLITTLVIPKTIICFTLFLLGIVLLTATASFADLILNSISLEFVILIDDTLYESLLPMSIKDEISCMVLWKPSSSSSQEKKIKKVWDSYRRSTFYFVTVPVVIWLYMRYGQYLPMI